RLIDAAEELSMALIAMGGDVFAEAAGQRLRSAWPFVDHRKAAFGYFDKRVVIALKEARWLFAEQKNPVAAHPVHCEHEVARQEIIGYDNALRHSERQIEFRIESLVYVQHQAIQRVLIVDTSGQCFKALKKWFQLALAEFLEQLLLRLIDQIPHSNRVLLVFRPRA